MQLELFYAEEVARTYEHRITRVVQREQQFARLRCAPRQRPPANRAPLARLPFAAGLASLTSRCRQRVSGLIPLGRRSPCPIPS